MARLVSTGGAPAVPSAPLDGRGHMPQRVAMRARPESVAVLMLLLGGCVLSGDDRPLRVDAGLPIVIDAGPMVDAAPPCGLLPRCPGTPGQLCLHGRADDLVPSMLQRPFDLVVEVFDRGQLLDGPATAVAVATLTSADGGVDRCGRYALELAPAQLPSSAVAVRVSGGITTPTLSFLPPAALTQGTTCVTPYLLQESSAQLRSPSGTELVSQGAVFLDYVRGTPSCTPGTRLAEVDALWNGTEVSEQYGVFAQFGGVVALRPRQLGFGLLVPGDGSATRRGKLTGICQIAGVRGVLRMNGPPDGEEVVAIPGVASVVHVFADCLARP